MSSKKYETGKLNSVLKSLFNKNISGILSLKTQVPTWHNQRNCILMVHNGALVYGEAKVSQISSNQKICQMLGKKFKPNLIDAALSVAVDRTSNTTSIRELMELLTKMKVFTWQEAEAFIAKKLVVILEQFLSYPGQAEWQESADFDLCFGEDRHGLDWSNIKQQIIERQQKWHQYAPTIPRMDAIPVVTPEQLEKIDDRTVKMHLADSADGKNNLLDIADLMGKDPLKIAKTYVNWANNGWVKIAIAPQENTHQLVDNVKARIQSIQEEIKSPESNSPKNTNADNSDLPIVLSVDDSPIIQTSIKRALQNHYQVLLAGKAQDALKILHKSPVRLMLLDLTMPDVDGLEFCKMVRKIDKFHDLPIVMVTARDGLVNKMKGHIAGTSRYLTKPFEPEQLREVVREYINS